MDPRPLETFDTLELVNELYARFDAVLVTAMRPSEDNPKVLEIMFKYHGNLPTVVGLAHMMVDEVREQAKKLEVI